MKLKIQMSGTQVVETYTEKKFVQLEIKMEKKKQGLEFQH